jgi:hypothetical protein
MGAPKVDGPGSNSDDVSPYLFERLNYGGLRRRSEAEKSVKYHRREVLARRPFRCIRYLSAAASAMEFFFICILPSPGRA